MKKSLSLLFIFVFTGLFFSCGNKKKDSGEGVVLYDTTSVTNILFSPEYYFSGDFTYMADAASFKEDATGTIIPVAIAENFPEAEKRYRALNPGAGKPVYAELRGFLKEKGKDDEGPDKQLVISQVIRMDNDFPKAGSRRLSGKYEANNKSLIINPDHTYILTVHSDSIVTGNWYLSTESILALTKGERYIIMDVGLAGKQIKSRDTTPVIFTRQ